MPRTRVLIFGWASSVHVRRWAKGLSGRGYDIKVVSPGGTSIEGIETVVFPHRAGWSYLTNASAAAAEAYSFNPDIIHVHSAGGMGLWGLRTALQPMVVSVWGTDVIDLPNNPLYRTLIRRTLKRATAITATSNLLRAVTVQLQPVAHNKITVIPFGVEIPSVIPAEPSPGPIRICFLKMHEPRYAPDILLDAMAIAKQHIADIQLNMIGEGTLTELLRRKSTDLELQDNVNLLGFLQNSNIYEFISRHHFMVMPSLSESFGVAVLEASACGRPVIASNVGGVPEVLVDNVTGILVPKNDVNRLAEAIIKLARDADLRARLGRAGHEFVKQNYTWDKSLDMMTDLYERLIHEKK